MERVYDLGIVAAIRGRRRRSQRVVLADLVGSKCVERQVDAVAVQAVCLRLDALERAENKVGGDDDAHD